MSNKIHVLIADDHAIVRQGLKQILSETEDLIITGEADDGSEALQLARLQPWDVFLLDVSMPNRNGIDTLKQLKKEFPRLPVLILSMHPEEQYALRALKAGASGYLTKQSAPEQLVNAIRQVASGKKYVSPAVAQQLIEALSDDTDKLPHERITDREYQVLVMIAAGKSQTQIADKLNLGVATVSTYRARLLEKMGLKSTAELIRYGLEHGLAE
ncbi:MAG: response regulator transcription factor [Rhodocyclales bacterium]|jgi:two-component system invasion response regulator UvrY|nr:response regulator transcription factor [Rhodocyclales bacterium]MBT9462334.1 response regulator transcription factor [Rugosibacter sp.]MBH1975363.1 response regulator transcription factor [Rhodocyclales bacterium]MDD2947605.1 response regulator transcription factor [Rugosibacter sp.]MDD3380325.1 response regulator transcription factor [Rugosibacter sp.]